MHDTEQSEKAAGDAETRARARGNQPVTNEVTNQLQKRWSDDPWCNMTTGEAEAWRDGVRAALYVAAEEAADREGGLFTEMLVRGAIARLARGQRMSEAGDENDWPALRVLFEPIAAMAPPTQ